MKQFASDAAVSLAGLAAALVLGGLTGCQTSPPVFPEPSPTGGAATNQVALTNAAPTSAAPTNAANASLVQTNFADILYPGNRIIIAFSGIPNPPEQHQEQIRNDGFVTPPLLGKSVKAAGKRIGELQQELHDLYVPAYFKSLTVIVKNEERYFFVDGEVREGGQKPYLSQMTVLKAVQAARGFSEFADKTKVRIIRADGRIDIVNCKKALKDPRLDLPIYPGDSVHVPQRPI